MTVDVERGLVFAATGSPTSDRFRAFDAKTGALLWETALEASAHATPMTFMGRNGRQYVAIAAGGDGLLQSPPGQKIVAYALLGK
jgi:quinoprotein glucose dehydrogenase